MTMLRYRDALIAPTRAPTVPARSIRLTNVNEAISLSIKNGLKRRRPPIGARVIPNRRDLTSNGMLLCFQRRRRVGVGAHDVFKLDVEKMSGTRDDIQATCE